MKLKNIQNRLQKNLKKNKNGGIEGLPLQLMILIVIATLGTSVIIGWMGNIETPQSIGDVYVESGDVQLSPTTSYYGGGSSGYNYTANETISIYVTDQDKNPLEGASVVLSGLGVKKTDGNTAYGVTDSEGHVTFSGIKLKMVGQVGFIDVDVSKAGYGEDNSCRITVIA